MTAPRPDGPATGPQWQTIGAHIPLQGVDCFGVAGTVDLLAIRRLLGRLRLTAELTCPDPVPGESGTVPGNYDQHHGMKETER